MDFPSALPHRRVARQAGRGLYSAPGECPLHIFSAITPWALDPCPPSWLPASETLMYSPAVWAQTPILALGAWPAAHSVWASVLGGQQGEPASFASLSTAHW